MYRTGSLFCHRCKMRAVPVPGSGSTMLSAHTDRLLLPGLRRDTCRDCSFSRASPPLSVLPPDCNLYGPGGWLVYDFPDNRKSIPWKNCHRDALPGSLYVDCAPDHRLKLSHQKPYPCPDGSCPAGIISHLSFSLMRQFSDNIHIKHCHGL